MALNLAIIGDGSIASDLRGYLRDHSEIRLLGAVSRHELSAQSVAEGVRRLEFEAALRDSDVIVEAAGVNAVGEYGSRIVAAGKDFLVTSIGAFADPRLRKTVLDAGPGRVFPTTGAIGGLDLLAAAAASEGIDRVHLQTRKKPAALLQVWMSDAERKQLLSCEDELALFQGSPAEAISRYPASLNVAVALGLAVGDLEKVLVTLTADPAAELTEHIISAEGDSGSYRFEIRNQPSTRQPSSSGLTARSLLAGLLRLVHPAGRFI
ncbi:aspartate dehydrogenase domain-containing protein [Psychromicrobium sp. YIM B11713]|uniref:aspartate dehydrogenase domain-containing protein n=1 Tax=Psychromicrobium sp. YIM B11713 TaxID=3145233 RepID=UPI00374E7279